MAYVLVDEDHLENGLTTVCDSIRAKTGGTEPLAFPGGMKEAVDSIEQGGGLDLVSYLQSLVFADGIQEVTEDITLHLERATSLGNLFDMKTINAPKVTVYISNLCTNMSRSFGRAAGANLPGAVETIEIIGDTSKVTTYNQAFQGRRNLKSVVGAFDFSSATNVSMFDSCAALQEFRIVPNTLSLSFNVSWSSDLTNDTIQSLVDGYKDMTGQTSPVLTLHPDVKEKLTDTQIATLASKNVTIA